MIHYPPFNAKREETLFTKAFEENGVEKVVYGHLHASAAITRSYAKGAVFGTI